MSTQNPQPVAAAVSPAFRSVFTEHGGVLTVTEAEGQLVDTLRQLMNATTSIEARADWEAWQILRNEVGNLTHGKRPAALDLNATPLLFVAAYAVHAWVQSFQADFLPGTTTAESEAHNG